jgi:hypothetical protein
MPKLVEPGPRKMKINLHQQNENAESQHIPPASRGSNGMVDKLLCCVRFSELDVPRTIGGMHAKM